MSNSKSSAGTRKARKPHPDFPLFPHQSGRWCKKVLGKFVYFGKVDDDPKGERAIALWLEQRDELLAGRTPQAATGSINVKQLCNDFLNFKRRKMEAGELSPWTHRSYRRACGRMVSYFGGSRSVAGLKPQDFADFYASLAKTLGPMARSVEVQVVKTCLKWAYDSELLEKPVRTGPGFKAPSAKTIWKDRRAHGERLFTADEVRRMIDTADLTTRAYVLLAINCAFGQTDIATLPMTALDLDGGWITHPRPKTQADRRCKLWDETTAVLRRATAGRPADGLAFVTARGLPLVRIVGDAKVDSVRSRFERLRQKLGLDRPGAGFYSLRHTHRTITDAAGDDAAAGYIMGHVRPGMARHYVERIDDSRLEKVVEHLHRWLRPEPAAGDEAPATVPFQKKTG